MPATVVVQPIYYKFGPKSLTHAKKIFGWPKTYVAGVEDFQLDHNNQHYSILVLPHCLVASGVKECFLDNFFLISVHVL